jgi:hypothetical protein
MLMPRVVPAHDPGRLEIRRLSDKKWLPGIAHVRGHPEARRSYLELGAGAGAPSASLKVGSLGMDPNCVSYI